MKRTKRDLSGRTFAGWSVLRLYDRVKSNYRWLCRCVCGAEKLIYEAGLITGNSRSCGCLSAKFARETKNWEYRTCTVEGCERRHFGTDMCHYHYQKEWRKTHPQGDPDKRCSLIDMTGQTVGLLTIVERQGACLRTGGATWRCLCVCGKETIVTGKALRSGSTKSCGCWHTVRHVEAHKNVIRPEYRLLLSAKSRAKKRGLPFDLEIDDLDIPELCPVLGIPLRASTTGLVSANSPTVDRIIQEKGYTKGNVWVISWRANTLKNDATLDEIQMVADALRTKMEECNGASVS